MLLDFSTGYRLRTTHKYMSKYVKELMMDQLKSRASATRQSVLILDFKGLDAIYGEQAPSRAAKEEDSHPGGEEYAGQKEFLPKSASPGWTSMLSGPSVAVWGGDGVAELAKEISAQVKKLKKPEIKGGAVDGVVITPAQVEDITKLPSREVLIGQVISLLMGPAREVLSLSASPGGTVVGQLEALVKRHEGHAGAADPSEAEAAEPNPRRS